MDVKSRSRFLSITIFISLLFLINANLFSQINIVFRQFNGKDVGKIRPVTAYGGGFFYPFKINLVKKDSAPPLFMIKPSINYYNVQFKKNLIVDRTNGYTSFIKDPNPDHIYKKRFFRKVNSMQVISIHIPVSIYSKKLKFKGLGVYPGIFADYLINGLFVQRFWVNSKKIVSRKLFSSNADFYGINKVQYGFSIDLNYNIFTIYCQYALTPIFLKNEGIDLRYVNLGMRIFISRKFLAKKFPKLGF